MDEYKAMYTHLFHAVTRAVSSLQSAQLETEDMFVSSQNDDIAAKGLAFKLLKETLNSGLTKEQQILLSKTLKAQKEFLMEADMERK